jgi:hypothetical protein
VEWLENDRVRISQRLNPMSMGLDVDYRTEVYQRTIIAVPTGSMATDTARTGVT